MTIWPFLHIACFLTYLYLGFFVLLKNPKSMLHKVGFLLLCCFALWSFGMIFIHNPHTPKPMVRIVANFISIGWIGYSSCILWFLLIFTEKKSILSSKTFYCFLFLIPAVLYYQQAVNFSLIVDYSRQSYGWAPIWGTSPFTYLFAFYYFFCVGMGFFLIAHFMKATESHTKIMQSGLILFTGSISFLIGTATGLLLPLLGIFTIPDITTLSSLVWVGGVSFAMVRYEFFTITPEMAAEHIISRMAECLILVNTEGDILRTNHATVNLLGYGEEELRGKPFAMLFAKERFAMELHKKGETEEDLIDYDCECRAKTGIPIPVSLSYSVLKDESKTIQGFVCIMRDMTKYRHAEYALQKARQGLEITVQERTAELAKINEALRGEIKERKQAEYAFKASEEKYRTILENMEDGYFEVDIAGRFTFFNTALCKRVGYSAEELMGMSYKQIMDEKNAKRIFNTFNRAFTMGIPGKVLEYEFIAKDGKTKIAETPVSLLWDAEGNVIGFRGLARDITEQRNLGIQLQRAQKMEAIGTLAGGVAHDLNNILSGIVTYPELLLMDLPQDSPLRNPVLAIQKSGERAASVVQDLLTLARRGVTVSEVTNLNIIVSEYLKSLEYRRLMRMNPKIRIKTNLADNLLNTSGSPNHLSKSLMNLISNGIESMPDGGDIVISTENQYIDSPIGSYDQVEEGDYVVLKVHDSGIGIPPEDVDKIFEPFYTKKVMGRSGTGLGLAVVWGTVKDHKGYIDVQSVKGKGTTFSIYFHITREKLATVAMPFSMKDLMGGGESILVVDDVKEQREIATAILQRLSYSVKAVASGEEAVEYMKHNSADLLLIDMIMDPGIDGLETYQRILEVHPGQKALITSGFSETKRIKAALKRGAGQYVKKPYTLENIGIAIKNELEKRKSTQS